MPFTLTHVPAPKPGQASAVDVSDEVKTAIDEMYAYLRENPKEEGRATFDSEDERKDFTRQARAYCATREAGALKFRQLPSKSLPATEMRFAITADLPENGQRESNRNK